MIAPATAKPSPRPITGVGSVRDTEQRWLVHHYCQGTGLSDNLRLLCQDISVEVIDQHSDEEHRKEVLARMADFDRIVVEPVIARQFEDARQSRLTVVPTLAFRGYHPDFFLLRREEGRQFAGPTGSSQSMIAYCAYIAGRTERDAVGLYREEVYSACGYLDQWSTSREELLSTFRRHGLDLGHDFVRWSRRGPFMHSIIHPRIDCLRDVARKILESAGLPALPVGFLPPDSLAYREVLPVYPEIARRVGIAGSYLFKGGRDQRVFDLHEYVEASFAGFRRVPDIHVHPAYVSLLENVKTAIEGFD